MKNYYKALAGFQQECPVLLKDTDGYGYKYVDLTKIIYSINPLMKKHGLGFTQKLGSNKDTGQACLTTTIFHAESGESDSGSVDIPLVEMKGQNLYQSFGSGISYLKRYSLASQLGIVSDKDVDAYGEDVKRVAVNKLDIPKKKVVPPTGDPTDDIPIIQKLLKAKKDWKQIESWLRLTYDDLTIEEYKQKTNEQKEA